MKSGLSLVELAREIERQSNAKKDFVARTDVMAIDVLEREKDDKPSFDLQLRFGNHAKLGVYEDGRNNPEARANTFVKRHIEGLPDDLAAPRYEYGEAED